MLEQRGLGKARERGRRRGARRSPPLGLRRRLPMSNGQGDCDVAALLVDALEIEVDPEDRWRIGAFRLCVLVEERDHVPVEQLLKFVPLLFQRVQEAQPPRAVLGLGDRREVAREPDADLYVLVVARGGEPLDDALNFCFSSLKFCSFRSACACFSHAEE